MRKGVFITARTDSSRLPNKALLEILGQPTLQLVIKRAKLVKNVDEVVLCTTERNIDDSLANMAEKLNIKCFRGSLEDKLERWRGATERFDIDVFATFDGDDLFCDPYLIECSFRQIMDENCDFIKSPKGLICGAYTYCIRTKALRKVCEIKGTSETEMMWTYFEDTGLFKISELKVSNKVLFDNDIRLTLDYPEDMEMFKIVLEHYKAANNDVSLKEIATFLKANPSIVEINAFRQAEFLANQKKKTKLLLKEQRVLSNCRQ